jgi:hypothetical protein
MAFSAGGGGSDGDNAGPPDGKESMMECGSGKRSGAVRDRGGLDSCSYTSQLCNC